MRAWFKNVLRRLSEIRDALGGISEALHALATPGQTDPDLANRVAALEREMERRHAEAEGLLLKAQGKYDAARAAEERTRRLAESAGRSEESEDDLTEEDILEAYEQAGIPFGDEGGGQEDGMHAVPSRLDRRRASRQSAYALKFGR